MILILEANDHYRRRRRHRTPTAPDHSLAKPFESAIAPRPTADLLPPGESNDPFDDADTRPSSAANASFLTDPAMRGIAVLTVWAMTALAHAAADPGLLPTSNSPNELARYIESHRNFDWQPLWRNLG